MSYNRDNYIRIKNEFDGKYLRNRAAAEKRLEECHKMIPELVEVDNALAKIGMAIFEETMKGKDGLEQRLEVIRREMTELRRTRRELLEFNGLPADYTDIKPECTLCGDTGAIGTKMCECMKKALIEAGYESSGIGNLIKTQSFETLDPIYFSDDPEAAGRAKKCREYAESFSTAKYSNLMFVGNTGLGKTHLSTAIAKTVIERGYDVVYETAQNIFSDFETAHFNRAENIDVSRYFDCELLIMDDLGSEMSTSFTVSCFYNIINTRINHNRSMIVNTNLDSAELRRRYSDRIFSRLAGEFAIYRFTGKDIRLKKLQGGIR